MAGQPPRRSSPRQDAKATTNPDAIATPTREGTTLDEGVAAATIIIASSLPRGRARRCSLQSLEDGRSSRSSPPPTRRRHADAEEGGGRTVVESPPQSRTTRRGIPSDFPVGGGVTVAATHARRGGRAGTVLRHTARYVVVAFDDDDGGEIRVSPKFLISGRIRRIPARDHEAPRPRAPVASSRPSAAAAAAAVVGDYFEERRPAMMVRFDMGRNSTAEYDREGPPKNNIFVKPSSSPSSSSSRRDPPPPPPPPDIVEHLPGEIDDDDYDDDDDNVVTLRNEEILAEWDEHFDDYRHSRKGPADYSFDERYNNLFFRLVSL